MFFPKENAVWLGLFFKWPFWAVLLLLMLHFISIFKESLAALSLCCCAQAFSSCGEQKLLSSSSAWAPHCGVFCCCGAWALGHAGFSSCSVCAQQLQPPGSRARASELWRSVLVALCHVGSSQARDWTHVPCIGRWILNHWTAKEVPIHFLFWFCLMRDNLKITLHSQRWAMHTSFFWLLSSPKHAWYGTF